MYQHPYYKSPRQAQAVSKSEREAQYTEFLLATASNKYRSEGKRILPCTRSK